MGKRKRIGLLYSYNEHWIAGAYYIENLVHALNLLPDERQPVLIVITDNKDDLLRLKSITAYKYIKHHPIKPSYTLPEKALNKLWRRLTHKNLIDKTISLDIDYIFPFRGDISERFFDHYPIGKKIFWIPDFQEEHLPHLFSEQEVISRKRHQKQISESKCNIVFSSQDALSDYKRLYPNGIADIHILNFAVTHPKEASIDFEQLKGKYKLPQVFFMCPNQFWQHKNHIVILKALKLLRDRGIFIHIAFSGKQYDYRVADYFSSLQAYIETHQLGKYITFLGFLPREEQLLILKNAIAIIQPSLCEGWSTVIEDVKAVGQQLIASNLAVHQEQLKGYIPSLFFDKHDEYSLADAMEKIMQREVSEVENHYQEAVLKFARDFINIVNR